MGYSALKAGFAFLPVRVTIGISAQIAAEIMPRSGRRCSSPPAPSLLTLSLFWFSTVTVDSTYLGSCCPA